MKRLGLLLVLVVSLGARGAPPVPRLSENYRHYCFDMNWVDKLDRSGKPLANYSKLSAEDHVRQLVEMNANSLMVFGMSISGYMFYDSKVGKRHPTLRYDYLKEVIRLGHAKGIAMELYIPTMWADWLVQQHPSWGWRGTDGTLFTAFYGGYHPDALSPAADWYVKVIQELIPSYGVDAFFADGINFLTYGQSEYTVKKFRQDIGRPYPKSLKEDPDWRGTLRWEAAQVENYWLKLRQAVKQQDPRVEVTFNGPGPLIQAPFATGGAVAPHLHRLTDYAFTEAGSTGEHITFVRGAAHPRPFKVTFLSPGSVSDPFDADEIRARVGRTLAEGGQPYRYDKTSVNGDANRHFTATWAPIFAEVREKEPLVKGAVPLKYVAVVASEPTMFYRGRGDPGSHANDLVGALRALDALHIQHDVVADWSLDADTLRAYQLVIVPNAACLSDRQAAALREYVRRGGRLWATAETSLLDENGGERPDFALADVLGIHLDEQPANELREKGLKRPAFLLPDSDHAILRGLPRTELILPTDSVYVTSTQGETLSHLILDAGAVRPSPGRRTERAAIHVNQFGSGQAVYVANSLFASARPREQRGLIWTDRLIRNVVEYLAPNPPWRIRGPQAIWAGMNYQASGKRHVIHLVNWQTEMPIDVEFEVTQAAGAGMKVNMVWPRQQVLQARITAGGRAFIVPHVGPHVIVTME